MSSKQAKSFKVPKIRREESKDNLRSVDINSRDCIEIVNIVKRSCLDTANDSPWQLKSVALVQNRELEDQFRAKKSDLKEEGRNARDLVEHFAFMVQRDNTMVSSIVKDGVKCKFLHQNSLGNSKLGVYLWRNADLQLRVAEGWRIPSCTLLVFKIVLGKCKILAQQNADDNLEPTPNFDCHVPQSKPKPTDSFITQLSRSQVYLYEYTEDCEPSQRPRQCLPYAVLTYDKVDNIPQTIKTDSYSKPQAIKTDSYSKRPNISSSGTSDSETAKSSTIQGPINKRDPRLGQTDSSIKPSVGTDPGLCVPRLTFGPLPKDLTASVSDPDDPRSQLNFLTPKSNQMFDKDSIYQPSFGPSDIDENIEGTKEEYMPHEPLSSLPPLKLPLLPDPLIPSNSQLDIRYTDPRFGYVDSDPVNAVPNDPRVRPIDPRFQPTFPQDPRLQQTRSDTRKQPSDPRLQQYGNDPRFRPLESYDPRFQQAVGQEHAKNFSSSEKIVRQQKDEGSNIRKKLSLSDYKKKVNLSKPNISIEPLLPDSNNLNKLSSNVNTQQSDGIPGVSQSNVINDPRLKDPRINKQANVASSEALTANSSNLRDPRYSLKGQSENAAALSVYSTTIDRNRDPRFSQLPSTSNPQTHSSGLEKNVQSEKDGEESRYSYEKAAMEDEVVEEPDHMAKTLNDLSDPDDASQSPRQPESPAAAGGDKVEDPMLSAAMQKLVEHSGNVTLFTEALRMLQESAEEFGDQLTDPEFLVKKIAEKIEELSKQEAQKLSEQEAQAKTTAGKLKSKDTQEIGSPDVMSPDINNESKSDIEGAVKDIPLENVGAATANTIKKSESKLDLAMQKTLEELERIEKSETKKPLPPASKKTENKSKGKKGKKESSYDSFLLDIPIPPEPTKNAEPKGQESTLPVQHESPVKLADNKGVLFKKEMVLPPKKSAPSSNDIEEEDDDMRFTHILPSLKEQKKPVISINLQMNAANSRNEDIDLRLKKASNIDKKTNMAQKKESEKDQTIGLSDRDLRKEDFNESKLHSLEHVKDTQNKVCASKAKIIDIFDTDIDERVLTEQKTNKNIEIDNSKKIKSVSKFIDPFGFDHDDLDDRNNSNNMDLKQKKEVNDYGDIDWRHASTVRPDVDMRSTDTSAENSQHSEELHIGDFDLRHSHSRSVSPTPSGLGSRKDSSQSLLSSVKKVVDPFGLDEDMDERLVPRSNTSLPTKESGKGKETLEITPVESQDSNSDSGALFDAYSLGKSGSSGIAHASNEFGDIDWRHAAAAEMGDFDMRAASSEVNKMKKGRESSSVAAPATSKISELGADPFTQINKSLQNVFSSQSIEKNDLRDKGRDTIPSTVTTNLIASEHSSDPFKQLNQSLQNMLSAGQSVYQQQPSIPAFDNSNNSHSLPIYESYSTKGSVLSSDKYSNNTSEKASSNKFSGSSLQQTQDNQGGFQNIMQNLDFSNLKNILASVQKPPEMETITMTTPGPSVVTTELPAEKQDISRQCFFTEFSPLKDRKDDQLAIRQSSPAKDDISQAGYITEKSSIRIPGFDISPEKESDQDKENSGGKTEKYDNTLDGIPLPNEPTKPLKLAEIKASQLLPSTPKDKGRSGSEDNMTPLPNISYQAAILESIEQSALKVRHDDSFMSELEESPVILRKKDKVKQFDLNQDETHKHRAIGSKRRQDEGIKQSRHKKLKTEDNWNKSSFKEADSDDDDDDDESGLIIDLSPSAKTVSEKDENQGVNPVEEIDLTGDKDIVPSKDSSLIEEIDLTDDNEPVLIIDDADERTPAKTKDEMTDMIEKSRKNMVIKLTGETKLVDPKTGKAFSELPQGSAIEVLGQSSLAKKSSAQDNSKQNDTNLTNPGQMIHSITSLGSTISPLSVAGGTPVSSLPLLPMARSTLGQASASAVYGHSSSVIPPPVVQNVTTLPVLPLVTRPLLPVLSQNSAQSIQVLTRPTQVSPSPVQPVKSVVNQDKSTDIFDCFRDKIEKRNVNEDATVKVKSEEKHNLKDSEAKNAYSVKMFLEDMKMKAKKELYVQRSLTTLITPKTPEKVVKKENETKGTTDNASGVKRKVIEDSKEILAKKLKQEVEINEKPKLEGGVDSRTVKVEAETKQKPDVSTDSKSPSPRKLKQENETKQKSKLDFGTRILESLTEVKSKLRSPEKNTEKKFAGPEKPVAKPVVIEDQKQDNVIKVDITEKKVDSGASSELEDGEISGESESEEPILIENDNSATGSSIPVIGASRPGQFNRGPGQGGQFNRGPGQGGQINRGPAQAPWQQHSPNMNRNVNMGNNFQDRQNDPINSPSVYRVGADWADIIQNPETRAIERIKATNISSPSLRASTSDDAASIVSKSAASITRNRQKYQAQSRVKTLGEWLKLELEIDNIEPLKHIIPYALDTDLTKIPKQRKRRIRMKVKNAIQQEGSKFRGFTGNKPNTVTVEVLLNETEKPKPLNPNYLPEVSNEQTERELRMLGTSLNLIREKVNQQMALSHINEPQFNPPVHFGQISPLNISPEDKKLTVAMTYVESEMKTHLARTCFYGYPHRRVPDELLLDSELAGFKTEAEDVFLILMMPFSMKPYQKLLQLKASLTELYNWKKSAPDKGDLSNVDKEVKQLHSQRQAVLRGFTGYLNKKRIQKLQETIDKYTLVYDYFKMKTPPTPDVMLKFIRTTQMDLRQHLILARQYLALDEQKNH